MKTSWIAVFCVLVVAYTMSPRCFAIDCWVADDKDTCEELYGPKKNECGEIQDCHFSLADDKYICTNSYKVTPGLGDKAILAVRLKLPDETGRNGVDIQEQEVHCGTYRKCQCEYRGPGPTDYQCINLTSELFNMHKNKIPYGDQHNCMPSGYGDGDGGGGGGDGYGG